MAELIITYGDSRPPVHCRIEKPKVVLGRDPSCDICLDPGDVSTSRRHAQISLSSGTYLIEDLGSKNGTLVNDQVRPSAKLAHGDRVTLGTVKIVFHDRDPATTTSVILADTLPRSESSSFSGRDNELALSQQRLKMLYDLSARLLTLRHQDELLREVMNICFETLHFERGAIAVRKPGSRGVEWPVVRNLYGAAGELKISRTILGRALDHGERAIINESDSEAIDPTVSMVQHGIKSAMCVPLIAGTDDVLGVIYGDRITTGGVYRDEDVDFLAALGRQVSIGLINARLLEEQKIKLKLESEIALAREIQCQLFPAHLPNGDNVRIAALNEPGRHVSGDYYDVLELGDGRIALLVADVTGEGVAASLLMANLQAAVRVTLPMRSDLPGALARWNQLLYENTEADKFATCLVGIVDRQARMLTLASAGHQLPFMLCGQPRTIRELEVDSGLPLGIVETAEFSAGQFQLTAEPCTLYYYTDGVSEAMNEAGQQFGAERLRSTLMGAPDLDPDKLLKHVRAAVREFRGSAEQSDDITMLALTLS